MAISINGTKIRKETCNLLEIRNAACGYKSANKIKKVLENISFEIGEGEIICILGANGIGKTTLFKSILGSQPLLDGAVFIDGSDMKNMTRTQIARKIAYVPQSHTPPFPFTVEQIVVMGRTSHMSAFAVPSDTDNEKARKALQIMNIEQLKDEPYTEISGGERQLTLIARAIAQEADYLIMDEPTSNLDFGNQVRVMECVRKLAASGKGILITTHYPDHVFMAASKVAVIEGRKRFITGTAESVLTVEVMREIYGIDTAIVDVMSEDGRKTKTVAAFMNEEKEQMPR